MKRRNPYPMQHVWEALTTKERSAILTHTGKDPLAIERFLRRMVARKPIRLRGAQPDFLETDFGNYPNVRKNPFRALHPRAQVFIPGDPGLTTNYIIRAHNLRGEGARGSSHSDYSRRRALQMARILRRAAYKSNPSNEQWDMVSGPTLMQRLKVWRKLRTMSKAGARRRWYTENIKEALTQIRRRKARR